MPFSQLKTFRAGFYADFVFAFKQQDECDELRGKTYWLNKLAYLFHQGTGSRVLSLHGVDYLGIKFKSLGISQIMGINMEPIANRVIALEPDVGCTFHRCGN